MAKPEISVVIPTYNRQDLVVEAVESVLAQTYTDFEIIVVDDGSTDDTAAKLRPYLDRLQYVVQKNRGVAAARNGHPAGRRENLSVFWIQNLWEPGKLDAQLRFANDHPEYALISTEIRGFDGDKKFAGQSKASMYEIRNGMVAEHLLFGNWIQTSTVMLRRTCYEVGWFDEDVGQFGEDWLLWMRVASKFPIYFLPEPLVLYRFHTGQLIQFQTEEQFRSLMRCLEKLSSVRPFQQKPQLLREAEYRICVGRAWRDRDSGEYERAMVKLKRAFHSRRFPIVPVYMMIRTVAESKLRRRQ